MTRFASNRYDRSRRGGLAIPQLDSARAPRSDGTANSRTRTANGSARDAAPNGASPEPYGYDRLERAVRALVDQQETLRAEVRALREKLDARDRTVRDLESELLAANQRRQDTGKRIDELIGQLDQLDAQLASAEVGE